MVMERIVQVSTYTCTLIPIYWQISMNVMNVMVVVVIVAKTPKEALNVLVERASC